MDIRQAIDHALITFRNKAILTKRDSWQALDVRGKPDMATHELIGFTLVADLMGRTSLDYYRTAIKPYLPWSDDHFAERICGQPLNPPPSESYWPGAPEGNDKFKEQGIFSHTYPERFYPREAGNKPTGIRYRVGDFDDFIRLLERDPYTRQAYFPIFFPEDTGNVSNIRVPCTLGYQILRTNEQADIFYFIRSCDLARHFRQDIYLAIRFLLEVLVRLQASRSWTSVKPGMLRMTISSLHCFRADYYNLFGEHR